MVKKKSLGDRESYSKEGEKEWFSHDELRKTFGKKMGLRFSSKTLFKTRTVGSHEEYELTECMLALYLFHVHL